MTPRAGTRDEIVAYVDRAADVVQREGAAACATLAKPAWRSSEWYIFVLDGDGRTVCHPMPQQIGASAHDLADSTGKRFGDEFLSVAAAGGGWVEYAWPRPGETTPLPKVSYVRQVTASGGETFVVGSGGHEVP